MHCIDVKQQQYLSHHVESQQGSRTAAEAWDSTIRCKPSLMTTLNEPILPSQSLHNVVNNKMSFGQGLASNMVLDCHVRWGSSRHLGLGVGGVLSLIPFGVG